MVIVRAKLQFWESLTTSGGGGGGGGGGGLFW
jgi:hypothetical protein